MFVSSVSVYQKFLRHTVGILINVVLCTQISSLAPIISDTVEGVLELKSIEPINHHVYLTGHLKTSSISFGCCLSYLRIS